MIGDRTQQAADRFGSTTPRPVDTMDRRLAGGFSQRHCPFG
ncbi:hypothetical protein [Halorhabdus tiamatea]|uniref:Uncharacterized protein n=1 Tax=Halorhabdus tiamatea SARL4B TaxID=1033806 RepID=S6D1F5_9EURY|nr:hypothetical protein [Halorhabdus tiamatea]CCQ34093.1 hypothetical protein HTIA_1976 [Halorhabdus tiamatea SARL4B]